MIRKTKKFLRIRKKKVPKKIIRIKKTLKIMRTRRLQKTLTLCRLATDLSKLWETIELR